MFCPSLEIVAATQSFADGPPATTLSRHVAPPSREVQILSWEAHANKVMPSPETSTVVQFFLSGKVSAVISLKVTP